MGTPGIETAKSPEPRTLPSPAPQSSIVFLTVAFACYLALSVVLWWGVWSTHPTSVTTCGCGDTSLFLWFLEWPAYALAHGHNPFYSTALFHPQGIDLLSNTSVLAIGLPLSPVTWIWGPVATLNVASTLGPALSSLAMCWLLGRWVRWSPAAFVGGLAFGFSPFVLVNLAGAHLMSAVLVLVPLIVACLDDILVRQRRSPLFSGVALGVLVTLQFFLGTEVLTMVVLCGAIGLVLLIAYGALGHRQELSSRAPHALRGLGVAATVAVVLLGYPAWFALDGPAHLSGLVWPTIPPGTEGISLSNIWHLTFMETLRHEMLVIGGYQGPALPQSAYLGLGMLAVVAGGVLAWRRDRRLWLFGTLGMVSVVLSLGMQGYWTPWRLLTGVPLLQNVIPGRIVAVTNTCVAVMLGVVVDRAYGSVRSRARMPGAAVGLAAVTVALAVAAVALVPLAAAMTGNFPLATRDVTLPRWFTEVAPHLPRDQVVLTYPAPFTLEQSAEGWQAIDGLHFAMVGGSGPEGVLGRAGKERAGQEVISASSFSLDGPPKPTPANIDAVRQALSDWGVTQIVMPDPASLPRYDHTTSPAAAVALLTVVVGRKPEFRYDAWIWSRVRTLGARRTISEGAFAGCTTTALWERPSHQAVSDCVMAASRRST